MSTFGTQARPRSVRIHVVDGRIEGCLRMGPVLRTLDDLNVVSRRFLQVYEPVLDGCPWRFVGNQVAVNTSTILFVEETGRKPARKTDRDDAPRYTRAAIHLRVGPYDVRGFLHVPPNGDPMTRLMQDSHPFLALTSASVVGADLDFTAGFLAVNRAHIVAAEPLGSGQGRASVERYESPSNQAASSRRSSAAS